jgi:ankyrin repeat protein
MYVQLNMSDFLPTFYHHLAANIWTKQTKKVMEALLEADANVNALNKNGRSPLHVLASKLHHGKDDCKLVNLLLSYGAIVDSVDENKLTPLHLAVQNNNIAIAKELVVNGAPC